MKKIFPVCFIKQVVEVTIPTAISALKLYDVGFHHQLVFLVRGSTVCVWIDLLDFYRRVIHLIVSLVTLVFLFDFFFLLRVLKVLIMSELPRQSRRMQGKPLEYTPSQLEKIKIEKGQTSGNGSTKYPKVSKETNS